MKRTMAVFALVCALSPMVFAHGSEKHVMGTVTSISDGTIVVKTTSKETVTVSLNAATKFLKSGSPATLKDLKVGDKVVIHAKGPENNLVADEVRFGPTAKDSMSGMRGMDHTHASDSAPENH